MKTIIQDKLKEIEKQYDIKILFACESGSRAWGFPSPDSDYDVRFIYVRPLEHYLSIQKKVDHLSFRIDETWDIYGWDLSKTLQLIGKSNTTPFEWLQSPMVYMENESFRKELWNLCQHYFCARSNAHHYLGIAKGATESIENKNLKIKKLFYILRPLLSALWCVERKSIAPMSIFPLLDVTPTCLRLNILSLIEKKQTVNESFIIQIEDSMKLWIDETFEYYIKKSNGLDKEKFDSDLLDSFFRKTIMK
ncbi:nucleotidyltransferase domain-containing protein [Dysgonomonas sp. ZJ709]|uniref:nucleotidyltransferase domain-containing protein n=1 Tax=Dysgonomonas sp. ZJ709 TaxID=2709797 RepID=UPI0013EBA325|nr:nucleotidyltransferase domain-containing protein [Dysgonomonas sp. ZJ709]